jgi:5-methylcytosine-specific restriction enzyme A
MSRSVAEWCGKSDDAKVPDAVRLRVFRREGGVCYLSGAKIGPGDEWDLEHKVPLASVPGKVSGLHRESNLFPALVEAHKLKTAREAAERAKADAVAKRHLGITQPTQKIQSAGFKPVDKEAKREARRIAALASRAAIGQTEMARRFGL